MKLQFKEPRVIKGEELDPICNVFEFIGTPTRIDKTKVGFIRFMDPQGIPATAEYYTGVDVLSYSLDDFLYAVREEVLFNSPFNDNLLDLMKFATNFEVVQENMVRVELDVNGSQAVLTLLPLIRIDGVNAVRPMFMPMAIQTYNSGGCSPVGMPWDGIRQFWTGLQGWGGVGDFYNNLTADLLLPNPIGVDDVYQGTASKVRDLIKSSIDGYRVFGGIRYIPEMYLTCFEYNMQNRFLPLGLTKDKNSFALLSGTLREKQTSREVYLNVANSTFEKVKSLEILDMYSLQESTGLYISKEITDDKKYLVYLE